MEIKSVINHFFTDAFGFQGKVAKTAGISMDDMELRLNEATATLEQFAQTLRTPQIVLPETRIGLSFLAGYFAAIAKQT
ncbi:MAG: hypothetical protein HY094_02830 [Candidatus Melainabacteria bacterium]|nr:hypothetical protein [Candidatus Melainabacteria bacterium]